MSKKDKKSGGDEITGDEWLGTYSDCVTLLMTFFVLLYSMSTVDEAKLAAISNAFSILSGQTADSILEYDKYEGGEPIMGDSESEENSESQNGEGEALENDFTGFGEADLDSMYDQVQNYVNKFELDAAIDVAKGEDGIVLQIRDNFLFDSGSVDLKSESSEMLEKIDSLIKAIPNEIVIEGHTDNVPISGGGMYADNWDLSAKRATNVLRYFTERKAEDPARFSVAGYGEYRPLVENTTEENKAVNRRVNILLKSGNDG